MEEVKLFLNPRIKNLLPNPFILKDMEKAVNRTIKAISKKEKIGIFGDYDVDGATSTAILGNYFSEINQKIEIYIPDRKTEGYGPSKKSFEKLISGKLFKSGYLVWVCKSTKLSTSIISVPLNTGRMLFLMIFHMQAGLYI